MKTAFKYLFATLAVASLVGFANTYFTPFDSKNTFTAIEHRNLLHGFGFCFVMHSLFFMLTANIRKDGRLSVGIFALFIFALFSVLYYVIFNYPSCV